MLALKEWDVHALMVTLTFGDTQAHVLHSQHLSSVEVKVMQFKLFCQMRKHLHVH